MKFTRLNPLLMTIFPAIAFIPILIQVIKGAHSGGVEILFLFLRSSITPSRDLLVIQSAWHGLQVTFAIAIISWIISMLVGVSLGLISSNIFGEVFPKFKWVGVSIRWLLAIPRAIHELVWGLFLLQILGLTTWVAILSLAIPYSSLMARVVADQLDNLNHRPLIAIKQAGSPSLSAITTTLLPPMVPVLATYGGYRLECAIRGATILGIFGLGGIGTDLKLTLQSLEFQEMWTCLWMLALVMFILEKMLSYLRKEKLAVNKTKGAFIITALIFFSGTIISLIWTQTLELDLLSGINIHPIELPNLIDIKNAFFELPLLKLVFSTLLITLLASGVAIGTPPIALILSNNKITERIQGFIFLFFRLIPPPLTALLLLVCTDPTISVAALALGITNIGVMGRVLKDTLTNNSDEVYKAIKAFGASKQSAYLYGVLSPKSKSYLSYASYRTDVVLRETAVVGIVGGVGLGWQLQESLSSFDWAQVAVVSMTFISITLLGEYLCDKANHYWLETTTDTSLEISLQS